MTGEKTEQPTYKKLRDAREKGQVAKSKELVSACLIASIFIVLWTMADFFMQQFTKIVLSPSYSLNAPFITSLQGVISQIMTASIAIVTPVLLMVFVFAIGANFVQIGALFTIEPIIPKLEKLDPTAALKNIFSMKNLFELIKSIIKITVLSILIYITIRDAIGDLIVAPSCGLMCLLAVFMDVMKQLIIVTIVCFVIIAAFDVFFQQHQYIKGLMMSKDEIKQEYKQMEGSPEIKGKRKQFHREIMSGGGGGPPDKNKIKQSSALVTNPTHYAVGLYYHQRYSPIPLVSIKGKGYRAEQMIRIAKENNVPIIQNVPLARGLYYEVNLEEMVHPKFFKAIAEIINWLNELRQEREGYGYEDL